MVLDSYSRSKTFLFARELRSVRQSLMEFVGVSELDYTPALFGVSQLLRSQNQWKLLLWHASVTAVGPWSLRVSGLKSQCTDLACFL